MKLLFFLFICVPFAGFSQSADTVHYKIYNTATRKPTTTDNIIASMSNADVLFFGEEHNDSTAHLLEYGLLKKLNDNYPNNVALSMEMFQTDCQLIINEYLAGLIREKNLISDARAWPNYNDYKPMVELAKLNHIPVIAANAPSRYTNMVTRNGLSSLQQLDVQAKSYLPPLPIDTATGRYYEKFAETMGGHASMPGMQIYQSQNLWDATMGWYIARFYKSHPGSKTLQLNGGFHSEEKLGTVAQLKKYAPKARVITIASYADEDFKNPNWSKISKLADFVVLTDTKVSEEQ